MDVLGILGGRVMGHEGAINLGASTPKGQSGIRDTNRLTINTWGI